MDVIIENIQHAYGDVTALDGIDLIVHEGEFLALIGPSGCGKSTLLGIIGGILQATRGSVRMRGEPRSGSLNPFTYVFQDFALLPWRSVEGNVALALEHHRMPAPERARRVDDVLDRTGLTEFRKALPRQLSGGMRQRVGIARALAANPSVLLMDEPLSALDAQTRELLMEDFLSLWLRERLSVIYVTHNLAEALRLADRIVVLSRRPGKIRRIVEVPLPQTKRTTPEGQAELAVLHQELWSLIKAEAQLAEREIVSGEPAHA